jgi:hypothetical protein
MIAFESQATTNETVEVKVSLVRHFGKSDVGEEPSTKASPVWALLTLLVLLLTNDGPYSALASPAQFLMEPRPHGHGNALIE